MKTYIYPDNLRASVKLWFWSFRDFIIICAGINVSVTVFANFWKVITAAATICFALISLRADDMSVLDYIINAVKYFLLSQQEYRWKERNNGKE